jgi:hypothetical protein
MRLGGVCGLHFACRLVPPVLVASDAKGWTRHGRAQTVFSSGSNTAQVASSPQQAAGPTFLICWACSPDVAPDKQKLLRNCRLPLCKAPPRQHQQHCNRKSPYLVCIAGRR